MVFCGIIKQDVFLSPQKLSCRLCRKGRNFHFKIFSWTGSVSLVCIQTVFSGAFSSDFVSSRRLCIQRLKPASKRASCANRSSKRSRTASLQNSVNFHRGRNCLRYSTAAQDCASMRSVTFVPSFLGRPTFPLVSSTFALREAKNASMVWLYR